MSEHKVRYLLVGGYAVNVHGYVRATMDIDVWIAMDPATATSIARAVQSFGFAEASADLFRLPNQIIRMSHPPIRIAVLTSISGRDFDACYAHRTEKESDGLSVTVISLSGLIENKRSAGRAKYLAGVEALSSTRPLQPQPIPQCQ